MLLIVFLLFTFGLCIGSFLNVVIYRSLHDESPMKGRSKCPHCHKQIAWYDNIPLLSYVFLGGKCRHCHQSISLTYPVVEFITGLLFVWWYLGGFLFFQLTQQPFSLIQPFFWLLVGILLLVILVADATSYIIPDFAVMGLLALAVIYRVGLTAAGIMQVNDFLLSLVGTAIITAGFFFLWFATRGKGMGFGDVKYCLPMGLLLGWPKVFVGVFLAFVLGSLIGVLLMMVGKKHRKSIIPFGPFLVIGTVVALVYGEQIIAWYLRLL